MNRFKYEVSFRIFHPVMHPDDICQTLNMRATIKQGVGEGRKTPKGTPLSGIYTQSYCSFKLDQFQDMQLAEFLNYWNRKLLKSSEFLNRIHSSGGRIEYFIGWYSVGNSGEVFDVSLLEQLVSLKINLAIDFYGG